MRVTSALKTSGGQTHLDDHVVTAASGVVERRATFSVLEVDGIYGVDGEQFAEHELRRVAAVVPAGQMQRGRLVLARLGVQNYNRSINQSTNQYSFNKFVYARPRSGLPC